MKNEFVTINGIKYNKRFPVPPTVTWDGKEMDLSDVEEIKIDYEPKIELEAKQ